MGSDSSSSGARAKRHAGGNGPRRVHSVNLNRFVMIVGIVCNLFIIATGILSLVFGGFGPLDFAPTIRNVNANWALVFFAVGLIIFGIIGILGECQLRIFIRRVAIFHHFWTKTLWYTIMGLFSVGLAGSLGICTGIICWIVALFNLVLFFMTL